MGGFPPARIILVVFAFMMLAIPLARLTGFSAPPAALAPFADNVVLTSVFAEIRFTGQPEKLVLRESLNDRVVAEIPAGSSSPWNGEIQVRIPEKAAELKLEASWSGDPSSRAVTVRLQHEDGDSREQTAWSDDASMNEILRFQW